jgi:flagellar basal-body rod modification protein FlgD
MTVATVQNEAAASVYARLNGTSSSASTSSKSAVTEMSDRFLKLLVTQLKNQDPTNPMENAELTSQLAQMSTVEGINKMNSTLDGLVSQFKSSQVMQGAALVGRQVLAEGDTLTLGLAGAAGGVGLSAAADSVQIKVFDGNGALVQTLDLGQQDAGLVRFVWDGSNASGAAQAAGDYTFKVDATASAGATAAVTASASAYALGNVLSVSLNDNDMSAEVSGLGARSLNQIRQIF